MMDREHRASINDAPWPDDLIEPAAGIHVYCYQSNRLLKPCVGWFSVPSVSSVVKNFPPLHE